MAEIGPIQFQKVPGAGGSVGANSTGPTLGISGGEVNSQPTLAGKDFFVDGMDASWGANIPGFINELLAPQLAARKQERMWQGFVKAREGATMEEINADQPWFSNLFGPTDYQMGATMYTTMKTLADYENDIVRRMPELRELPAEEMGKEFNRQAESMRTGDDFTDAMIHKQMMDRAAPMMDLHTKNRTAWLQAEQIKMQVGAIASSSTAYNSTSRQYALLGKDRPMEVEEADRRQQLKLGLYDSLTISRNQNDQSAAAVYEATIRGMADRGEFYSIRALEESGVFSAMDPEQAQKMRDHVQTQERKYKQEWASDPLVIERIAELQAMKSYGIGGLATANMAQEVNRMWQSDTGAQLPFYTTEEVGNFAGQGAESYIRRRERVEDRQLTLSDKAADQAAKDAAEARDTRDYTLSWLSGGAGEALFNSPDEKKSRHIMTTSFLQLREKNPEIAAGTLVNNLGTARGVVVQEIADVLQGEVRNVLTDQVSDGFVKSLENWRRVRDSRGYKIEGGQAVKTDSAAGQAAALAYYGPELHARFTKLDDALKSGVPVDAGYRMFFGQDAQERGGDLRGIDSAATKQNVSELRTQISDQSSGWFGRVFANGHKLHPSTEALLASSSAYYFEQLNDPTLLPEDRAKQAVLAAKRSGLEIGGAFGWENGKDQQPIQRWMRADGDENFNDVIDYAVRQKLAAAGGDANDSITVIRVPDQKGEPVLHVLSWGGDGYKDALLRGSEIKELYRRRAESETNDAFRSKPLTEYYNAPGMFDTR